MFSIPKDILIDDLKVEIKKMSNDILLHEFTSFSVDHVGNMDNKSRSIAYELRKELLERMDK